MDVKVLLDDLEAEVSSGRRMPLGGGVVVDRARVLDLLRELRTAIPANIREARNLLSRSDEIIAEAEERAARIVADAEQEAEERVANATVVRSAQERAYQIEVQARERAQRAVALADADAERRLAESEERVRAQEVEADAYAMTLLSGLEERLTGMIANIREAMRQFGS